MGAGRQLCQGDRWNNYSRYFPGAKNRSSQNRIPGQPASVGQIITIVTPGRQPLKDGNPESGTRKTTKALSVLARRGPLHTLNRRWFTHPSVGTILLQPEIGKGGARPYWP